MASSQAGGRRHAQTDVVPNEDLSGGGGGAGGAASQEPQRCCCMGAGGGGEGGGDGIGWGGCRGGRVGGGLEESRGRRGGSVCRLVGLVKGCGGAGEVQAFEHSWWADKTSLVQNENRRSATSQPVEAECTNIHFPKPFLFGVLSDNSPVYEMHLQNLMQSDTTVMQ